MDYIGDMYIVDLVSNKSIFKAKGWAKKNFALNLVHR